MKLFHVSEEPDISIFEPRKPLRDDLDKSKGLVWAINECCLPNFLTPRDCPRVTYHAAKHSTSEDITKFFSSSSRHCVSIEYAWFERMAKTRLFVYEFDSANFYLQDQIAGFYVSECVEMPVSVAKIDDLFSALFERCVEIRILDNLWPLGNAVQKSTLNWSLCRMRNAATRV
ncbi:MAG: hypothetical protein FWB91_01570 [Defluviitaleaceae bacterium]|nr:hypothetical protein [Defluviitaleaceae bacterium]